ncbi:MAG: cytidine deaminase [Anaerolineae bacterium]|nr:cytidine deaminase [Anaerolineae bacterium]
MGIEEARLDVSELDTQDQELVEAARDVIRKQYREGRHSVGAAVRSASGRIYTGVNVESCGYGPCAEPIAFGAAISRGDGAIVAIVAVARWRNSLPVIPPCGNCRQMLVDYVPKAWVILEWEGTLVKARARDLLPAAYRMFE